MYLLNKKLIKNLFKQIVYEWIFQQSIKTSYKRTDIDIVTYFVANIYDIDVREEEVEKKVGGR